MPLRLCDGYTYRIRARIELVKETLVPSIDTVLEDLLDDL